MINKSENSSNSTQSKLMSIHMHIEVWQNQQNVHNIKKRKRKKEN